MGGAEVQLQKSQQMIKKAVYLIISTAVLVSGYLALGRLNYWERSVRIFKFDTDQPIEGRGRGGFEGRESGRGTTRPDFRNLPDSVRQRFGNREGRGPAGTEASNVPDSLRSRFEAERGRRGQEGRSIPDSMRREYRNYNGEGPGFEAGMRGGSDHGRGGIAGKKINLGNVWWFTAVFASFTVVIIYIDKLVRRKRVE